MNKINIKGKRVLITGADGFIGSHLARHLMAENAEIHALMIKDFNIIRIQDVVKQLNIWHADLRDYESIRHCLKNSKPQIVFHLASLTNVNRDKTLIDAMYEVNLRGTANLIKAIIEEDIDIKMFINTGSCEEYGDSPVPFHEELKERPVSPYSASKVAATYFCKMVYKTMGVPTVTVRPFLTYGPHQDKHMFIPSVIHHCLIGKNLSMTKGEQTREFNYVDDIAEGFLRVAACPEAIGEIINIGNGTEYVIKEIAQKIVSMMGDPIKLAVGALPYRPGEAKRFFCSNEKAKRLLGWAPKIGLDEGLAKTIRWYKDDHINGTKSDS